jgi:type II secretory pathway component PulK
VLLHFRAEEYRRISPFLSALPVPVRININTAPEAILLALTDGSEQSVASVKSFVAQRQQQEGGYTSPDVFANLLDVDDSGDDETDGEDAGDSEDVIGGEDAEDEGGADNGDSGKSVLGVNSEYFEVRVIAEYGKNKQWLVTTLFRDEQTGEIRLLARDMSQRFLLGEKAKDSKSDTKKSKNSESESTGFIGE